MTNKIGYARVSSEEQNLDRQIAALRSEGCSKIFAEKASGKSILGRPQLEKAINAIGIGDVLVVAEWDRATRSMMDGIQIMQRIAAREAFVKALDKPHLDLTTPLGRGLLAFLSAMAEDERNRIRKRSAEGQLAARKAGRHMGRNPKLTRHQQEFVHQRLVSGESARTLSKELAVAHTTILRAGRAHEARAARQGKGSVVALSV